MDMESQQKISIFTSQYTIVYQNMSFLQVSIKCAIRLSRSYALLSSAQYAHAVRISLSVRLYYVLARPYHV